MTDNKTLIGTCGNCGGPVYLPAYDGRNNEPACERCGATVKIKASYGPILTMNP